MQSDRSAARRTTMAASVALALGAAVALPAAAQAQPRLSDGLVRIGVLTDMSGTYASMGGPGSVIATQMAVDDCLQAECKGMKIEVVAADHQNKADIAAAKAQEWIERDKVDALVDLTNSAAALAVQKISAEKGAVAMHSGPATTRLTNEDCTATGFHWMFDTYSLSAGTAEALTRLGNKDWFFLTVDYAFGHSLERDASKAVLANGGKIIGSVRHPLNTADFSSFLLQAQASKAQIVALANGGQDTVNAVKQANEFGIPKSQKLASLLLFISDIHALGLETAQGLIYTDGFYWDHDERSRAFAKRFEALHKAKPTMVQGGVYSSTRHYLKAVAAAGTDEYKAVAAKMREIKIDDPVMNNAAIRADGRVIHDTYLVEVKKPAESSGAWDYLKVLATIPAERAFQPLADSTCPLVKK